MPFKRPESLVAHLEGTAGAETIEKLAWKLPRFTRAPAQAGRHIGQADPDWGRAIGAGGGALMGAGVGAVADPEDRTRGALLGAAAGGVGGLGVGQFATRAGRQQARDFGLRQLHGATGYLPGQAPGKAFTATHTMAPAQREAALSSIGWHIPKTQHATDGAGKFLPGAVDSLKSQIAKDRSGFSSWLSGTGAGQWWENSKPRELLLRSRMASENAQRQLVDQGLTSLPGAVRGYALGAGKGGTDLSRLQQLKANLIAPGLVMGVGMPVASLGMSAVDSVQNRDPKEFAADAVDMVGWSAFSGLPALPGLAVGQGIGTAARHLMKRDDAGGRARSGGLSNEEIQRLIAEQQGGAR